MKKKCILTMDTHNAMRAKRQSWEHQKRKRKGTRANENKQNLGKWQREIPWKWVVETIMNGGVMSIEEDKEKKKGDREVEGKSGKVVKSNKCEGVLGRAA